MKKILIGEIIANLEDDGKLTYSIRYAGFAPSQGGGEFSYVGDFVRFHKMEDLLEFYKKKFKQSEEAVKISIKEKYKGE